MSLFQEIHRVRQTVSTGHYPNEASICNGIVLPILRELGWPVFDTQVVAPEYLLENRRVDYALCHPRNKPVVFIEVKQPGRSDGADRQLFEYVFHVGTPLAVLTDGREWNFYLPAGQGQYHERRVYSLDLVSRDPAESEARLRRYLDYSGTCSLAAYEHLQEDYAGVRRAREIDATLPLAWQHLLRDEDSFVAELLADQVENLCGFKPDLDTVAQFISTQTQPLPDKTIRIQSSAAVHKKPLSTPVPEQASNTGNSGFTFFGEQVQTRNAIDTLIKFFERAAERDASFLTRFAALPRHGRSRRYLAQNRADLYPGRTDLAWDYAHEVVPGWWIGTNYSTKRIRQIIEMACEVIGLKHADVHLQLVSIKQ